MCHSYMKILLIAIVFLIPEGCSSMTPHQIFLDSLSRKVGKKWNELPSYQFPPEKNLISTKILPNGNIEKRYKVTWGFSGQRTCIDIYEIDPKTDIIVGASFEGKETDCVINP